MCGINGFTFKDRGLIERMNAATKHRGPDGVGSFVDDAISIGHNLLAIADTPSNSNQPVISDDYVLAYNGEIYNYKKLRTQLAGQFHTDSDTEVIFAGLARHGIDFLSKLDGMFAIAWYDRRKKVLFLARDSAGMKPIYYTISKGHLIFSSELRGLFAHDISRHLNQDMVSVFFALGYVPGSETLVKDIYKVMPGEIIAYSFEDKTISRQWLPLDDRGKSDEAVRDAIGRAVNEHTMGLRPFGLYLSGGLDSTIILHELSQQRPEMIKTYTTRFDLPAGRQERSIIFNEDADRAQQLCHEYRIEHHELLVREQDFIDAVEPAIAAMEEPRYNHSVPAYWLLAKEASKDVVVILNGSGGDELFRGYGRYEVSKKISDRLASPLGFAMRLGYRFAKGLKNLDDPLVRWAYVHAIKKNADGTELVRYLRSMNYPRVENQLADMENAVAEYDRLFWLADEEFLRTDKIAMHFGMEGRFPLLARDLRTLANTIPSRQKGASKAMLREIYRTVLPPYIIQKDKTGWNAPVTEWMKSKFGAMVHEVLSDGYYQNMRLHHPASYTLADLKTFLPLFSFKIWARYFQITV
ncbi:MAG: asparagine synthase (glutamine-hydrolyzing) [Candidatus Yanofskybacteria bacterium RIFCSPLOWO2_01_FULL_49_25]|uniref:asparagine synthase (glutamine-hydrolyzing) n=1 Tax=Candidatus Yanofskybacteria bacterium RIFCSPLOWO2_01_FULL_49_25 TaxID=1802701 RepID=A0A1F8GZU1_9BACT|nr:MAG: asparagine synthase (glutamine-hydrolyzing) [Candidatus Yanofskybacteria bacterium RIFCSPLOWO2_01_FULL_49_25]